MNKRDQLKQAIREYISMYWSYTPGDDELERYLSGVMAFLAVEQWDRPFTQFAPPVVVVEEEEENEHS